MDKGKKVLIVDDQEGIRKLLAETCTLLGYDAAVVPSGKEALERVKGEKFQLAIVDMKMPGMSGLETLIKMRSIDENIKKILMTGYGESSYLDDAIKQGVDGVVLKPFDLDEIRKLLEELS